MSYQKARLLTEKRGNNIFAWDKRGSNPTLTIPSLIDGKVDDVKIGKDIVFEEVEGSILRSCTGLKNFVRMDHKEKEVVVVDNHNHALYFWIDAVRRGVVEAGFELIHIDEHSDLWDNEYTLDLQKALESEEYAWDFTNLSCNVGNYIKPALSAGLVGNMIRIENEYQIDTYLDYSPPKNSILNIDLDIFSPELSYIDENKTLRLIQSLLGKVKYVTIATSPFFIEQGKAIEKLQKILNL